MSDGPWVCFHCDETFTTRECAAHHFGHNEGETPICIIKGAGEYALIDALRKAQQERDKAWSAISAEDTGSARVFHALRADHAQALIREEERGYAKGLADGQTLGAEAMRSKIVAWAKDGASSAMSSLSSGSSNADYRAAHRTADWFTQLAKDVADEGQIPAPLGDQK